MSKATSKKDLTRQYEIERMAREAVKTSGITKALEQAILHGERDKEDYSGAFDAIADMADSLSSDLTMLADEINVEKWQ